MTIQDIEKAVLELPPSELEEFSHWFEEYLADRWDRQIADDAAAGRLDKLGKQADDDFAAERCTPL